MCSRRHLACANPLPPSQLSLTNPQADQISALSVLGVRCKPDQTTCLLLAMQKLEDEIETFDETREEEAEWLNKVEFARVEQVDKCARLEASIVQMQAAIQAADQRAAAAEVQVATAEQRAAAAEEAATAALEAAQLQVQPQSSHAGTGFSSMRPQVTSMTPGVAAR